MPRLREFFTSSSGLAPARQGLALGWVISVLTGITVLLGVKKVEAEGPRGRIVDCYPNPEYCRDSTRPIYCYDKSGHWWCTT